MGHGHSNQRIRVDRIIQEVKDIQSYIRKNFEEFDDKCRDNLHKRLIDYSKSLQDVFESAKRKNSKECRDATKFVASVINEIYQQRSLDSGAVDSNSFIHVSGKDSKLWGSNQSINQEKKFIRLKSDLASQKMYSLPSLEEIKNKINSLKRDIDNSIENEDINQYIVHQKIVQILATDLEMSFEDYTPLQETKKALGKDLSLMYRKIERAKKRNNDVMQLRQKEIKKITDDLTQMNTRTDQIMSLAHTLIKEGNISELMHSMEETANFKLELDAITINNKEVLKMKSDILKKIDKIVAYLSDEISNHNMAVMGTNDGKDKKQHLEVSDKLKTITTISLDVDHCLSQAKILIKEKNYGDLLALKTQILQSKHTLQNDEHYDDNEVMVALSEVEEKIRNTLEYLESFIERCEVDVKLTKTRDNLEKAKNLIDECRKDIMKFDQSTSHSDYDTYNKHLNGLESFLHKIITDDVNITKKKEDYMRVILDCRQHLREKFGEYIEVKSTETYVSGSNDADKYIFGDSQTPRDFKIHGRHTGSADESGENNVIIRKLQATSKSKEHKCNTIDGFYSYWRELQSNLPSYNCTYGDLKQISLLLNDIEEQIRHKRKHIENFLYTKQKYHTSGAMETSGGNLNKNKSHIDGKTIDAVKTSVKIYKLNDTKKLIIDDDQIVQNIDEINQYSRKISKQNPERVFLPSESSNIDSIVSDVVEKVEENCPQKANSICARPRNTDHTEYISQIQNIANSVQYLREKSIVFSGSKQSPRYMDIKSKLNSYRKTLNILISYQNENITLSCNRVLNTIDEVLDILNKNTESLAFRLPPSIGRRRNTIETLFTNIIEMKSRLEDIRKTIESFEHSVENGIYLDLQNELLHNRKVLNEMQISSSYEVILNSKAEVLRQIDDNLYNLDMKLEENKMKQKYNINQNRNGDETAVMNEFKKTKDKVDRFSGTYKNVLYREIEKSIAECLNNAESVSNDKQFVEKLRGGAIMYMKILEEKALKEHTEANVSNASRYTSETKDGSFPAIRDIPVEVAILLSEIRQHYRDIRDRIHSTEPLTGEVIRELDHRIGIHISELNKINIVPNEPFYFDIENLLGDFLKLSSIVADLIPIFEVYRTPADGESISQPSTIKTSGNDFEGALSSLEENMETIRAKLEHFGNEKGSVDFFNLDEALTRLSMDIDKLSTTKGTDLHKRKKGILKNIYAYCDILENKAQSFEILQNVEKKMIEVKYRLDNFQNLSDGDYNALHKELTDLDVTLRDLNVSGEIADKRVACQMNIQQCVAIIENRVSNRDVKESDSDDGTSV